jgi:hypothetical protein
MKHLMYLFPAVALVLIACTLPGLVAPASPTSSPTNTEAPSATPPPTTTPTSEPSATPDASATAAAQATDTAAGVLAELDRTLGDTDVKYNEGHLLWRQTNPFAIRLSGPGGEVQQIGDGLTAGNFVFKADVTWVASGWIVCGAAFRSEPNLQEGKQYRFSYLRLSGLPAWAIEVFEFGRFQNSATDVRFSGSLDMQNGSTNTFLLVVQDDSFSVYLNERREGRYYDFSRQRSSGAFGFLASQDSGKGSCTFENAWVWSLD